MKTNLLRAGALACALLTTTALTAPAMAQTAHNFSQPDANGVDLTYGDFRAGIREGSIGSGEGELPLIRNDVWVAGTFPTNGAQWDRIQLTHLSTGANTVVIGMHSDMFSATGTSPLGTSLSGSDGSYTYTRSDGTAIAFGDPSGSEDAGSGFCNGSEGQGNCSLLPITITSPDGKTVTLYYDTWNYFRSGGTNNAYFARINSVTNSDGYRIQFAYSSGGSFSTSGPPPSSWYQRTGASFFNDHVSTTTAQASVSYSYPSSGVTQVTDMGGNVWQLTGTSTGLTAIRRPGASSDTTTITYGGSGGTVSSVTRDGVTTSYSRSVSGSTATMTVTDALSHVTTVVSDLTVGRPTSITDPLSRVTGFTYDSYGRLTRVTAPEGNYVNYTYDSRGNITETRRVAKSGSGLSDIVTSATYASSCSDPSCNEPLTTTDALGNVTNYTYSSTHGGVLSVTAPAPSGSGTRPETRYSYTLDTSSGTYRLTGTSTCASGDATSGCIGTANEAVATMVYDANGNTTSLTRDNGLGTLTATSASTYDNLGNLLTVDGPLSGTADTTRYRYNSGRQLVGVIGPDPDGIGSLHNRAQRTSYTYGLPTKVEIGTVNSQSDSDWTGFTTLQQTDTTYDSNARPIRQVVSASSTTYSVTDLSYDSLGRPDCTAQRMNPSAWGTVTAACTLQTTGNDGDDRITRRTYDSAGQVTLVQTGYGVSGVQADEVITTYRNNGQVETVTDAMGNKTTYVYDGQDRLSQTRYPSTTQGAGTSNSSDYEQLSYDAASNVTSRRLRDGTSIGYTYDAVNRLTYKDLPSTEPDVTYTYDLMNRMTGASYSGHALTFTYDALGRNLSQVGPLGTVSYTYDTAGRRTTMTYPGSTTLVVGYNYDTVGEVTSLVENPSGSNGTLGTFVYDNLGRRTSLTRGDGTSTSYSYDNMSRLTQLAEDLDGVDTYYDQTLTFGYNAADQVTSTGHTNDLYAWGGHYAVNRNYTANGLNQYTASGSITPTYDSRGNLTSAGSTTYSYSSENLLTGATGSVQLGYDPLGRLAWTTGSPNFTRFAYDGQNMVAEYDYSSTLQRRYVFGPGTDEPLVWYEGSGLSTRRFFHPDERGSIVAITDNSGAVLNINTYDEHGIPGASNTGRFQYTGQAWLPEIGMYYYRARMYSPTLGRFLQTDPIGYGDGMNLYAYVGGDPINGVDPTGTDCAEIVMAHGGDCASSSELAKYLKELGQDTTGRSADQLLAMADATIAAALAAVFDQMDDQFMSVSWEGPADGLCIVLSQCAQRSFTREEITVFARQGIPRNVLTRDILVAGLPPGPYYGTNADGYTMQNYIYLRFGIGPFLQSPTLTGVVGEEVWHSWQYSLGVDPLQFAYYQTRYGHDQSPLEVPAMAFNARMVQCRSNHTC